MPPPLDYVLITSDSFAYQVQVAEFNIANERWFRMDTGADPVVFGWYVGLATGFNPDVRLFESDGTTQLKGSDGALSVTWPLANNSTYYIQVRNNIGPFGPIIIAINTLFEWIPIGFFTVPAGSFVINDDRTYSGSDGFPSAVYDSEGNFLGYIGNIPAGETGDALPDGTSLWHDRFGMFGGQLALFAPNYAFIDDFTPSPAFGSGVTRFPPICNDGIDFYAVDRGGTNKVFKLDVSALTLADIATLGASNLISAVGVKRDGSVMYWAEGEFSNLIKAWDLNTNSSLGTFYTITGLGANFEVASTGINGNPGEILVLLDGTVVTYAHDFTNNVDILYHISAAGTLINSYTFDVPTYGTINHIHYSPNGSNFIRIWFYAPDQSDTMGSYGQVNLLTGVYNELYLVPLSQNGTSLVSGDDTIFKPSTSCTLITNVYSEAPSGITVIKQVVSSNPDDSDIEFDIETTGLDPAEFTLTNGESRLFSSLSTGVYSVTEETKAGFQTTYSVSNGDDASNINFTEGDSITVTITNTRVSSSGIYKIQPGKRNDTLWISGGPSTQDVKIPDPTIRTAKF